jgi:hypothetical protein
VTSPGPSPPRSKKESSDASDDVVDAGPEHRLGRRDAKLLARSRRAESRREGADRRAQTAADLAAKAAEQGDSQADQAEAVETPSPLPAVLAATGASELPAALAAAHASEEDARLKQEAKDAKDAKDAKERARRERAGAKEAARRAKAADRTAKDDHIVEPPREPKPSMGQRVRAAVPHRSPAGAETAPASERAGRPRGRRLISLLAGIVGAVGLVCSVILALGALLVALGADGSGVYDLVSGICDSLVGPLRDIVSFSGTNADLKEKLVAWGGGAIIYLMVGLVAQSLLRSAADD